MSHGDYCHGDCLFDVMTRCGAIRFWGVPVVQALDVQRVRKTVRPDGTRGECEIKKIIKIKIQREKWARSAAAAAHTLGGRGGGRGGCAVPQAGWHTRAHARARRNAPNNGGQCRPLSFCRVARRRTKSDRDLGRGKNQN